MARTTISIPDELKARMDEIEGWNWSGVAQEAFQRIVDREAALVDLTKGDDMNAVIERLKVSKGEYRESVSERVQRAAFEAGTDWAKNRATYSELASLAQTVEAADVDAAAQARGLALVGFGMTDDEEYYARQEANVPALQFWDYTIGLSDDLMKLVKIDEESFGPHFFEGAMAVWEEVAEQLDD